MKKQYFVASIVLLSVTNLVAQQNPTPYTTPSAGNPSQAVTTANAAWYRGGNTGGGNAGFANIFGTSATWNSPIYTQTNGITRTRLNGTLTNNYFGFLHDVSGHFGIGLNGYFNTATNVPLTMLHLEGLNNTPFNGGQFRHWMRVGTLMRENSDAMYVGMKPEAGTNRSDAVVNWSDDSGLDKLRFLFTSTLVSLPGTVNPLRNDSQDGYEFMRMTSSGPLNQEGFGAGHVGIGPLFSDILPPQNRLHMNAESGLPTYMQVSNVAGGGRPGTGQTGTDGLKLGMESILSNGVNRQYGFLQWQENTPFIIQTDWDAIAGGVANGERMRITSIGAVVNTQGATYGGLTTPTNRTRIAISHDGNNPITRPLSLLHLGYNTGAVSLNPLSTDGWRTWMDIGMFTTNGTDNVYIGLKAEPGALGDRQDAVLSWGDNQTSSFPAGNGPDNMRFIFTSSTAASAGGTPPATGVNGLEGMRMTPTLTTGVFTGIGGDPTFPNLYGPTGTSINATATLEVNSWGATNVAGGSSGLRFTNLNSTSPTIANTGTGVLSVDANGDVIYVQSSPSSSFGGACNDPVNGVLAFDTKVDLNNQSLYFTKNDILGENHVGIGFNCATPLPGKLSVYQDHPVAVNQNTTAIDAHNEDNASVLPLTFTGVKALVDGIETLPRIEHIAGDFVARNGQLNFGVRSLINANLFTGSTDYGAFIEVNDPKALVTFGTWSTGQGGSNSNWGVYATAAPRSAALGGSAVGYGGRFGSANHFTRNVGVWGVALDPFATPNHLLSSCFGVAGIAQNGASNYGVYGEAGLTGTNNAGYFTGNVQLTGTPLVVSDAQFKTNVESLPNALKLLTQLKPKTYFMDSVNFERMNFDRSRQFGFIAQDVAQIFPSLVKSNIHPAELDSNGVEIAPAIPYKSLNYNAIIPINTQAIIELNAKVDKATLSDQSIKTNVQDLNGSLDKVLAMRGVSYDWNHTTHPELNLDSVNHVGFIAQEMAQIDARLTYLDDDTLLHVEYDKVVPILAEAIEELNAEVESRDSIIATQQTTIDDLNARLTQLENCLSGILPMLCQMSQSMIENNTEAEQEAMRAQLSVQLSNRSALVLDQNVPNPFAEQTVINFSIPATIQKAQIHFYNGEGKLIQSVDVVERGLGSLTVFGSDLSTGIYTYTLVADGQIVATKKMMKQ